MSSEKETEPESLVYCQSSDIHFKIITKFAGHKSWVFDILYFPEHGKIVSASNDKSIRIWNAVSGKSEKVFHKHTKPVRNLMKFNESEFLSCGDDSLVFSFSVVSGKMIKKVFSDYISASKLVAMGKISSKLFLLVRNGLHPISVIDYMNCIEFKSFNVISGTLHSNIIISKSFPNSFYVNCGGNREKVVRLIDYEEERVVFEAKHTSIIYATDIYWDKFREEYLLFSGSSHVISLYHPKSQRCLRKITVPATHGSISTMKVFLNRYVIWGEYGKGKMVILDINDDMKAIYDENIDTGHIFEIIPMGKKNCVVAATDSFVQVIEVNGIKIAGEDDDEMELKDLNERVLFLVDCIRDDDSDVKFPFLVTMKGGFTLCNEMNVFRSFLLL